MIFFRAITYIIIFFITTIYFFPKNEVLFYVVENYIKKYDINIKATLENDKLSYISRDSKVYYKDENTAIAKNFKLNPFIVYNKVEVENITLVGMAAGFFPKNIKNLKATYSVLNPKNVLLLGSGDFGRFTGRIDLFETKVYIELTPSSIMKKNYSFLLKELKKNGTHYTYEYKL